MGDTGMIGDQRPILSIDVWPHGDDATYYSTTSSERIRVERIEVYQEIESWDDVDQMARSMVPWIRVWKGGEVICRVRASSCAITYEPEPAA